MIPYVCPRKERTCLGIRSNNETLSVLTLNTQPLRESNAISHLSTVTSMQTVLCSVSLFFSQTVANAGAHGPAVTVLQVPLPTSIKTNQAGSKQIQRLSHGKILQARKSRSQILTNAGSLLKKRAELKLAVVEHSSDGISITEMWCHQGVLDVEFSLPSYILFRCGRNDLRNGDGVHLMIKQGLDSRSLALAATNYSMDAVTCQFGYPPSPMNVCCVYKSPSQTHDEGLPELIPRLADLPGRLLLMGDFNSSFVGWVADNCSSESSFDTLLLPAVQSNLLFQSQAQCRLTHCDILIVFYICQPVITGLSFSANLSRNCTYQLSYR